MRIAVSGTHGSGKSTLIHDFVAAHRDYVHEPEPYEWLDSAYDEPGVDEFYQQLEISVERLRQYQPGANMIAERSPVDFLAYILALMDLGRAARDCALTASAVELAAAGVAHLDLLVFLPSSEIAEDIPLRDAMNEQLADILTSDRYSLFTHGRPRIVEISGSPLERLRRIERAVAAL